MVRSECNSCKDHLFIDDHKYRHVADWLLLWLSRSDSIDIWRILGMGIDRNSNRLFANVANIATYFHLKSLESIGKPKRKTSVVPNPCVRTVFFPPAAIKMDASLQNQKTRRFWFFTSKCKTSRTHFWNSRKPNAVYIVTNHVCLWKSSVTLDFFDNHGIFTEIHKFTNLERGGPVVHRRREIGVSALVRISTMNSRPEFVSFLGCRECQCCDACSIAQPSSHAQWPFCLWGSPCVTAGCRCWWWNPILSQGSRVVVLRQFLYDLIRIGSRS